MRLLVILLIITNENVAERSRTSANNTRTWPKRIGTAHREKPPPFCKRSANILWNETKRKKLSSVQLCCRIHGSLLPYVAIWLVIGRYRLKMTASKLYQIRSYRNPTLLPYETCLLPYANFCCDSFWIRSATLCYVFACDWLCQWASGFSKHAKK